MDFLDELRDLKKQVYFDRNIGDSEDYEKIIIAGMGGSGIAGKIFQELYTGRPLMTLDDYHVPEFADDKTLFIAMSYSGNTEEILTATEEAISKGCRVVSVTSGGKLSSLSDEVIKIPGGLQPRSSLGYMLMPLFNTFLRQDESVLERTSNLLAQMDDNNEEIEAEAGRISENHLIPVIYGFSPYRAIAYRWKTQFNENSKIMAFSNYFPELDHNEIIPLKATYRRELFRFYTFGVNADERIAMRIKGTASVSGVEFTHVKSPGSTVVEKLFYLIHYGDYLTYHLARQRNIDPVEVTAIEGLKKILRS